MAKNGEANRVYLSPQARAILDDLRGQTGGSEWRRELLRAGKTHGLARLNDLGGALHYSPLTPGPGS